MANQSIKNAFERMWEHTLSKIDSSAIQSNWNQNDESAKDYIKNRPFYTGDPEEISIVEETTFTLQDGMGMINYLYPLEEGKEYNITLDGTVYTCTCKMINEMEQLYLGNPSLPDIGNDTGELFFIAPIDSETVLVMVNSDTLEHTVSVIYMISEVYKIDEKYLPESIGKNSTGKESEIFNDYSNNVASGDYSHAEGRMTVASGEYSHAEGFNTTASGSDSHTEGSNTIASGTISHAEGRGTIASAYTSHAEGNGTIAAGDSSHAEGHGSNIILKLTGNTNSKTYTLSADSDDYDIKVGRILKYNDIYAKITAYDISTRTITTDKTLSSTALSDTSVNLVLNVALSNYSHTEGYNTIASGQSSHAEGKETLASGDNSHAEGYQSEATSTHTHAEGYRAKATASAAHAEGNTTEASGVNSHAEGYYTKASGLQSHAEGNNTIAKGIDQHVQGRYNIEDTNDTYAHIVGNGTRDQRSNAHTLDWEGNAWYAGSVEVKSIILKSSTEGSSKRFELTIDDTGTLLIKELV